MGSAAHIKQDLRILPKLQLDITFSRHHFTYLAPRTTNCRLSHYLIFYIISHSRCRYADASQLPSTTLTSRFAHEYPHPSHRAVTSGSTCRTSQSLSLVYTCLAQPLPCPEKRSRDSSVPEDRDRDAFSQLPSTRKVRSSAHSAILAENDASSPSYPRTCAVYSTRLLASL
jgi:hypothetical protein